MAEECILIFFWFPVKLFHVILVDVNIEAYISPCELGENFFGILKKNAKFKTYNCEIEEYVSYLFGGFFNRNEFIH